LCAELKPEDFETKFLERGIIFVHGKAKDDTILGIVTALLSVAD